MGSLLVKVRAKMAIYAHQKVRGMLEGQYGSVFKGRSMEFDDLREYIPGDDVKDIDWKATARSSSALIRRYVAVRKHNVLLVVDTGKNMTATTSTGQSKKDLAVLLAGIIGSIVLKHDDLIGLVAGDSQRTVHMPIKAGNVHLEQVLQKIDTSITDDAAPSRITAQLEYITKNMRRKMIIVVIADQVPFDEAMRSVVRRLRAQHEILWLTVTDADLSLPQQIVDVEKQLSDLPRYLRTHKAIVAAYREQEQLAKQALSQGLSRLAVASEEVESENDAVKRVFKLLERHRNVRHT
ncbi:MAG: DUF58 domain-containing protein [Candidatus Saccharimonas sp.]